jgi:hypothetical protein
MNFLRWFLGILLLLIMFSAQSEIRKNFHPMQPALPQKENLLLEGRDFVFYTVQPGDTLAVVQRKFRVPSEDSILQLNPDLKRDHLTPNHRIKIPMQ